MREQYIEYRDGEALLLKRLQARLATAKAMPIIDAHRIAMMGFCFGGL